MDVATLTNAPRRIRFAGQPFLVSALLLKEWGELQQFLKDNSPGPVGHLRSEDLAKLSAEHRRELLSLALVESRHWPPEIGTAAWYEAMSECEGATAYFVWTMLRKHQPELTPEDAAALHRKSSPKEGEVLIFAAAGIDVPKARPSLRGGRSKRPGTNGPKSSTG